ncbi:MAG: 2TM domain-containing protein, partial [Polyangiaceae bacterium]
MSNANDVAEIERSIRSTARRRVYSRIGFMWHLAVFVMVNAAMYAIDEHYTPQTSWFVWPLCGWGAGLLLHAMATFSATGMTEDMIQAEIAR